MHPRLEPLSGDDRPRPLVSGGRHLPLRPPSAPWHGSVDPDAAVDFLELFHAENPGAGSLEARRAEVLGEIRRRGTYEHTPAELQFGARLAWRNSARCIGRLYWRSLVVRDRRGVTTTRGVAEGCVEHLRFASNGGRIRPTVTVFAPQEPGVDGIRIWNPQLVRYAGYPRLDGSVHGDPAQVALTAAAQALGWPGGRGSRFDVLPLVVEMPGEGPQLFDVPADAVLEVPIRHPDLPWFEDLGLRWHAVPAISNMPLEIGGVVYTAAPFNGWYMGTEIGARNLADPGRYDVLPTVARWLGLDTSTPRTLWRDSALVELNLAVLSSFDRAGVTITDHHTESERFLQHLQREEAAGRTCPADWTWIVPPMSGAATPVFHRYYDEDVLRPAFCEPEQFDPRDRLRACPRRHATGGSPAGPDEVVAPGFTSPGEPDEDVAAAAAGGELAS